MRARPGWVVRGVAWLGLAVLVPPAAAALRVGRANGLCVRASQVGGGFALRGELLPLQASLTTTPGRLVFDQAGGLDAHTLDTLRQVEQALAREPVPGLAAAFAQHGVEVIAEDGGATLEGGSAGLAIFAAATSALLHVPLRTDVALTGLLTAEGEVRPVGGLGYKVDAAVRERIRVLVVPSDNASELLGATPDLPGRCRLVGVSAAHPALVEAFGDGGPFAAEQRAYAERYEEALRLYRLGRSGAARAALAECRRLLPDDLTARRWLAQAGSPDEPAEVLESLAEVARLARAGEWQAAAALAEDVRPVAIDPARVDWLLADLAARWSRAEQERIARPVREALDKGDLAAAQGWLDGAALSGLDAAARHGLAVLQLEVEYRRRRAAAEERPGDGPAWERVADAAEAAEEWEAAAEALRRARGLAPAEPGAASRRRRARSSWRSSWSGPVRTTAAPCWPASAATPWRRRSPAVWRRARCGTARPDCRPRATSRRRRWWSCSTAARWRAGADRCSRCCPPPARPRAGTSSRRWRSTRRATWRRPACR
ncbi:MAG: hypothetical protein HYU66_00315 [Armatimonadetes bacterium]|nr:hypothetical protein [Armatimonadota bacterium]